MTKAVRVFFAVRPTPATLKKITKPALVIAVTNTDWNDFGYKMRTTAHVLGRQAKKLDHLMMFENQEDSYAFLKEHIKTNQVVPFQDFGVRFCSLFAKQDAYRTLVEAFGLDATLVLLERVADATILRDLAHDPRHELLASEQFHLGVLREPDAYRAYRRGASYLKDRSDPPAEDAAFNFTATCMLPPAWKKASADFHFSSDVFMRERIAVLVGPNGTGKSTLLFGIADSIARGRDADRRDDPGTTEDLREPAELSPWPNLNGLIIMSSAPSDKYQHIRQTKSGPDYWSFTLIEPPVELFDPLTLQLVDVLRDREQLMESLTKQKSLTRRDLLAEVLSELSIWEDVHIPVIRKHATGLKTREHNDVDYISLKQLRAERRSLAATRSADISKRPVHIGAFGKRDLSSGELAMFRFAVQLISTIETACLVILDEPETHLHPQFIARMIETLDRVLKATKGCAIIATHSPFIVREVPRERVHVLASDREGTTVLLPRLQTFGAGIDAISDAIFGDNQRGHLHEKLLDHWLAARGKDGLSIDDLVEQYALDLNPETLSYLARRIEERRQ